MNAKTPIYPLPSRLASIGRCPPKKPCVPAGSIYACYQATVLHVGIVDRRSYQGDSQVPAAEKAGNVRYSNYSDKIVTDRKRGRNIIRSLAEALPR